MDSLLNSHRVLSPTASVRVSPICLGAMAFGEAWKSRMGECSKETAFSILDFFESQGGNFIDTAVNYQDGESEQWIGEWMASRGNRDRMVIATKFSSDWTTGLNSYFGGNSTKTMHHALETSLKRLQTTFIDLYYVHWWDSVTSHVELMQSLNKLVDQGKVLYLGISDAPAWFVAKCNEYARCNNLRGFSVYQGRWSAADREFERDIIPLCMADGMAIAPWGALGQGRFRGSNRKMAFLSENISVVADALEQVAEKKQSTITGVALAYVMHKTPYVFPICGVRTVEHVKGNIEALAVELTDEDIKHIEGAAPFDLGWPLALGVSHDPSQNGPMNSRGVFAYVEQPKAIKAVRPKRQEDLMAHVNLEKK